MYSAVYMLYLMQNYLPGGMFMDYNTLLALCTDLGYRLAVCGAETFRVEESINLIMRAYGIQAEVFAIPNNLIVSIETPEDKPITRMRRIGLHGNDLASVERYTNLSRRICAEKPNLETAVKWLKQTDVSLVRYNIPWKMIGDFLAASGFCVFFGGSLPDALISGICGLVISIAGMIMDKLNTNQFFRTIIASFLMSLLAYTLAACGIAGNADTVIIGALMILVPGLLFTNAMRDIIYGDTNSGVNRIVQVFLIAVAIALGTAAAWGTVSMIIGTPSSIPALSNPVLLQLIASFIACVGFMIMFNIHGPGSLLCALGGTVAWSAYLLVLKFFGDDLTAYFAAATVASLYSEIMARVRKYPAISYLVISIIPLIPGAGVYYAMNHAVRDNMSAFADTGMHAIAIAGVIAVGILLISTLFRMWTTWKRNRADRIAKGLQK